MSTEETPIAMEIPAAKPPYEHPTPAPEPHATGMFKGPAAYRPHNPWPLLSGLGATVLILVGTLTTVGLVVVAAMLAGHSMEAIATQIGATLAQQAAMIVLTWFFATRYGAKASEVMALTPPAQGIKAYVWAAVLLFATAVAMSVLIHLVQLPVDKNDIKMFAEMFNSRWWWAALVLVGIGAPLSEELLFRGYLFSLLAKTPKIGALGASLITSASFAAIHLYSPVAMAQVFVIGMVFAWLLVRTGSLRVTIVCHSLFNTLQALGLMYAQMHQASP